MTAQDTRAPRSGQQTGVYVYGILPGDVEVEPGAAGVGDPPGEVRVVRHEDLAALVSDVDLSGPLGRPEDLVAAALANRRQTSIFGRHPILSFVVAPIPEPGVIAMLTVAGAVFFGMRRRRASPRKAN